MPPTYEPRPGTMLIRATTSFYASVRPGEVSEIPTEIALRAIAAGVAVAVDTLNARLVSVPVAAPGVKRWQHPDGAAGPKMDLPPMEEPDRDDDVGAWREYAIMRGMDPAEAEVTDRASIFTAYGIIDENPEIV